MPARKVALREEAYEFLRKERRPGETFSDVIIRLGEARRPLSSFAGAWKSMPRKDLTKIKNAIRAGRERDRDRMDRLLKRVDH